MFAASARCGNVPYFGASSATAGADFVEVNRPDAESLDRKETCPATKLQLFGLRALPQGLAALMATGTRRTRVAKNHRKNGGKISQLARDGEIFSKLFNPVASRPYPTNALSLEQSIRVELQAQGLALTTSVTIPAFAGQSFTIAAFNTANSYLTTFDQYRFDQLEYWLEPIAAQGGLVPAAVASCVDLDDATTPTQFVQVENHQGALLAEGGAGRYHKWKPHMAVAVYSGTFTSFANEEASWIDSASPNVQHYGIKVAAGITTAAIGYSYVVRAVVSFRAPSIN